MAEPLNLLGKGRIYLDNSNSLFIERGDVRPYDIGEEYLDGLKGPKDLQTGNSIRHALSNDSYHLYLSDFQGVDLPFLDLLRKDSSFNRALFHLGSISENQNLFIDSLYVLFDSEDISKQQIILIPKLSGKSGEGTAVFKLLHSGRQLSSVVMDFSNLGKVIFDVPFDSHGEFTIQLEGDNVYYDNEFYFHLGKRIRPVISIISKAPSRYLKGVFGNKDVFDLQVLDLKSIDYQLIKQSDVVILSELENLPSGFISQIQDKTILVFPAKDSKGLRYWRAINNSPLLEESTYTSLEVDYRHPVFDGVFTKKNENSEMPFGTPIFDIKGDYEALISYRDNLPYLVRLVNTDTYIFNSSLDQDASNMASHSIFLPLMYQLALASQEYNQRVFSYPGDVLNFEVENQEYPPKVVSNGLELIPEFNPSENGLAIKLPDLEPGFYRIKHEKDSIAVAINNAKEESIMEGITEEELELFFKDSKHVQVLRNTSAEAVDGTQSGLWKYALILILLLVISETLLHRFLK